jgi:hypothetical protein
MDTAKTAQTPDANDPNERDVAAVAEYWAGMAMWVLVIATSLWDVAVTFGRPPLTLAAWLF